jgi:hypothetical protein
MESGVRGDNKSMRLPQLLMPILVCDNQGAAGINGPRARTRNDPQKTP